MHAYIPTSGTAGGRTLGMVAAKAGFVSVLEVVQERLGDAARPGGYFRPGVVEVETAFMTHEPCSTGRDKP